jgi:hypothetical protein
MAGHLEVCLEGLARARREFKARDDERDLFLELHVLPLHIERLLRSGSCPATLYPDLAFTRSSPQFQPHSRHHHAIGRGAPAAQRRDCSAGRRGSCAAPTAVMLALNIWSDTRPRPLVQRIHNRDEELCCLTLVAMYRRDEASPDFVPNASELPSSLAHDKSGASPPSHRSFFVFLLLILIALIR